MSTTVNENGFKPFANGGCQSLLKSTRTVSNPLLKVDASLLTTLRMGLHPSIWLEKNMALKEGVWLV